MDGKFLDNYQGARIMVDTSQGLPPGWGFRTVTVQMGGELVVRGVFGPLPAEPPPVEDPDSE